MKHVLTILIISFSFSLNAQLKQNLGNISSISELDEYKKAFNNPDLKKIKKSIDSRQNCFKLLDSIHTFRIDEQAGNELIGKQFNIYDDRFNLIQKDQYSQSKDLVIGRINYKYDSSNDLISENHLKRDFESEPFIITKSYHHVYNENHDLISTSLFDNNAYSTHQISRYFYTGEQLDSLHIYFSDENWESVKLCKSVIYTFENELKLKSNEIRFNESTGNWSFKVDSEFFYNTDGKLILHNSIEINAPGTSIKETNYEFEYDLFGNLILRTSRSPSNSGGLQKYHYDYNENNDLIEFCKDVEVFGNFGPYDCTNFMVDECGYILTSEYEHFLWEDKTKSTYFYSTHENKSALESLMSFPNPTYGNLNFDKENVSNNACISIYDINGKLVRQTRLNNHSLDISDLSSGMYIIKQASGFSKVIKL